MLSQLVVVWLSLRQLEVDSKALKFEETVVAGKMMVAAAALMLVLEQVWLLSSVAPLVFAGKVLAVRKRVVSVPLLEELVVVSLEEVSLVLGFGKKVVVSEKMVWVDWASLFVKQTSSLRSQLPLQQLDVPPAAFDALLPELFFVPLLSSVVLRLAAWPLRSFLLLVFFVLRPALVLALPSFVALCAALPNVSLVLPQLRHAFFPPRQQCAPWPLVASAWQQPFYPRVACSGLSLGWQHSLMQVASLLEFVDSDVEG